MRKALLVTAALGPLALAPLLSAGAQAAPNLVQNGGFEMNTLPATLNPPDASGAEIDSNWNYTGDLTGWFDRYEHLQHPVLWQCGGCQQYQRGYSLHSE
jgi:hypothetical protein